MRTFLTQKHKRRGWTAFILALLIALIPSSVVLAHPADMYAQEEAIHLTPSGMEIDWKITPGPLLSTALWNNADQNQDGVVSPAEAAAWARTALTTQELQLDGKRLGPAVLKNISWPETITTLQAGDRPVEIVFTVQFPAALSGKHQLDLHDTFSEVVSLYWFSLHSTGLTFNPPRQDSGRLIADLSTSADSQATPAPLSDWDSGQPALSGLAGTLNQLAVGLAAPNGAKAANPSGNTFTNTTSALTGLLKTQNLSPFFVIAAFLLSLALGSLHALTPGHGKTLVAAYLVGSRGRTRDAIFLGAVVTLTHTGSVLLLGLITLVASRYILPSLVIPILEVASGVFIIVFGLKLLIDRSRPLFVGLAERRKKKTIAQVTATAPARPRGSLAAGTHAHSHAPGTAHTHEHGGEQSHHQVHGHSHDLPISPEGQITWRSLLALGVSGGLVPCPDAIAILLVAVAVNRIPLGMLLIVAFSIGLALVLIAIGVALVNGLRWVQKNEWVNRVSFYAPAASALVVLVLGIGLTAGALNTVLHPASTSVVSAAGLPAFDPAKAKLLYLASDKDSYDQVFLRALSGGEARQLTTDPGGVTFYSYSAANQTILYTTAGTDGSSDIWAMNVDGANQHSLIHCLQAVCGGPVWSPDDSRILYERRDYSKDSALLLYSIWSLDLKTGKTAPLFQDQRFPSFTPRFSADGQWLSYISPANNTLQIYNLANGASRSIPYRSGIPEIWSPVDPTLLYWDVQTQDGQSSSAHLRLMSLSAPQPVDLSPADGLSDSLAAWSPDGQWIAMTRGGTPAGSSTYQEAIWLVKADGSGRKVLSDQSGRTYGALDWSPDGRYLAFSYFTFDANNGANQLAMIDLQSGTETKLLNGGDQPVLVP